MPRYLSGVEVYESVTQLLRAAATDQEVGPRLAAVDSVIALHCCDPEVLITVRLGESLDVWLGSRSPEPAELHLHLTSDDAVDLLLGQASVAMAVAKGHVRADGAVDKLVALAPILPLMARVTAPFERAGGLA